ncbi:SCP2 sterol-binding domain-containing protein [Salirhabdus sp. Marseille-P4669]|uniref:SCP2 sterol-binding domain-containing protein n=1 Tax=Salirhabdus sp. Marseille-P4669 TaxID=2042310 RepID=UPI000C7BB90E|nr:SCP2 sterol-binding domain-containing protein [Salirhabdus sp. Marseille-P4669]
MTEVKEIFQEIDSALSTDPSRANGVKAVYQFDISGVGTYQLVLREENSFAQEGSSEKPDCTLAMSPEDFLKMADGTLNGTQAFMSGRLKIKGNMGLALKLQGLLASYKAS